MNAKDDMSEGEYFSRDQDTGEIDLELMQNQYFKNKQAKVGTMICCPICNVVFKKKSYQQAFNLTSCKDQYHNTVNPERRNRAKFFNRNK